MRYLWFLGAYLFVAYFTFVGVAMEGQPYHDDLEMAAAIGLTWPVYLVKYILICIWYVLTLIYTGVVHAL